jgi:hypothetical protein
LTVVERASFDSTWGEAYSVPLARLWYDMTQATLNADAIRDVDNLLAQPG